MSGGAAWARADGFRFQIEYPAAIRSESFTGRVYLFFSRERTEPRTRVDWFQPEPFVGLDVTDWKPGVPLEITAKTPQLLSCPKPLAEVALGGLKVQAVARFNDWERNVGTGPGNGYSATATLPSEPTAEPIHLVIDQLVPEPPSIETAWTKLCEVRSESLSRFHQRDVVLRAAVQLPPSYHAEPDRRYPVVFNIPGFGGTHRERKPLVAPPEAAPHGVEFLSVVLDPSCPWGHHVFADSPTNGPWGTALVTAWLPEFERRFRAIGQPHGRFLTGHSSGGWSSLWVQITHPEVFGGVWSTAPDSVDFRDFQQANIYRADENAFTDPAGQRRPIARRNGQPVLWWEDFDRMEQTLGPGGQLRSFDAVFSPRGDDGRPMPLWDRPSGRIKPDVAKAWERYDIRLTLERNWDRLGPQLAGKLHVFMGDQDTFYLTGATVLLKESLAKLGSDAVIEIHAGKDHGSLLTAELRDRIRREMAEKSRVESQESRARKGTP
ncbi:MAG: alpha/beta hydrolase-fold protein [Planctomycetaceae bacterium]|nr:alpha/beta hydrolase-fold protein [Planctomycetaceae bacterium]